MVSLVTVIAFWKKKESLSTPDQERIIPLPNLPPSTLEWRPSTSLQTINEAREALKVLRLERQILGSALTTIYESHTKGVITEPERDKLLEKYKVDLKKLEKEIDDNQQIVEVYDLEVERDQETRNYKAKMDEIDARLKELKSGAPRPLKPPIQRAPEQPSRPMEKRVIAETVLETVPVRQPLQEPLSPVQEQLTKSKDDEQITDAEKRVEKIRAEILQAMDRLEQIEAEG